MEPLFIKEVRLADRAKQEWCKENCFASAEFEHRDFFQVFTVIPETESATKCEDKWSKPNMQIIIETI